MDGKKIVGLHLNAKTGELSRKQVSELDLDGFYEMLDCDCIDIAVRMVDGREFDFVCDDEALLKSEPIPSAMDKSMRVMLYGDLFICHHEDGHLTSLSEDDFKWLSGNLVQVITVTGDSSERPCKVHSVYSHTILKNVEYA